MADYQIPQELLDKYNVASKELYENDYAFYFTFLCQTDYICNKIVEGEATWEDYAEEKIARKFAREQLK